MKTPYDAVVRLNRRQVDEVKLSIVLAVRRIQELEQATDALVEEVAAEVIAAQQDWSISTHAYLRDRARQGAQLVETKLEQEQALARLREEAAQAYGALRVAEDAAQKYVALKASERERKQQAEADDRAAAQAFARRRRRASGS